MTQNYDLIKSAENSSEVYTILAQRTDWDGSILLSFGEQEPLRFSLDGQSWHTLTISTVVESNTGASYSFVAPLMQSDGVVYLDIADNEPGIHNQGKVVLVGGDGKIPSHLIPEELLTTWVDLTW